MVNIDKIKNMAKSQGIKIKFICSSLGLSETYLSNVKNGKDRMTPDRLAIIADLLHTTPAYLMDETDDPTPIKKESFQTEELSPKHQELINWISTADEGMVLTTGKTYGKVIYIADTELPTDYCEITDAQYQRIVAQESEEALAMQKMADQDKELAFR